MRRAIENQCYIIAPNQYGIGAGGKKTYGHSLIINPYGKILSEEKYEKDSLIQSLLKYDEIDSFRKKIPIKHHKKQFI